MRKGLSTTLTAIAVGLLLFSSINVCTAELISADYSTDEDGNLTLDTETNLEWLNPFLSYGLSVDDVLDGSGGFLSDGFRHATEGEIEELFLHAGIPEINTAFQTENYVPVQALIQLLAPEATYWNGMLIAGFTANQVSPGMYGMAAIITQDSTQSGAAASWNGTYPANQQLPGAGHFLVRPASPAEAAQKVLTHAEKIIAELPEQSLKNKNSAEALTNKIDTTILMIERGLYGEALDKLENDILKKTDGCGENGTPDKNDWIVTCAEQAQVYGLVLRAIELLTGLIP